MSISSGVAAERRWVGLFCVDAVPANHEIVIEQHRARTAKQRRQLREEEAQVVEAHRVLDVPAAHVGRAWQ